jgi:hypothetical protein
MSLKQKLHFGSKAQRNAARRSMRRSRAAKRHSKRSTASRNKAFGYAGSRGWRAKTKKNSAHSSRQPFFKPQRRKKNRARHRNPGEIIAMTLAPLGNPAKRRKKAVARHRRRKANASRRRHSAGTARRYSRRRKSNPGRRHHRRNPGGRMGNLLMQAVGVAGGAIGSKYLTQLVLGSNNTSWVGYFGNAVATGILGWGTHAITKNRELASAVVVGGATQIILRMLTDLTPFGQVVSGTGLGDYQVANFWMPPRLMSPSGASYNTNWQPAPPPVVATANAAPGLGSYWG